MLIRIFSSAVYWNQKIKTILAGPFPKSFLINFYVFVRYEVLIKKYLFYNKIAQNIIFKADWNWFENFELNNLLTGEEVAEINRTSFREIIIAVSNIQVLELQPNVFSTEMAACQRSPLNQGYFQQSLLEPSSV